MKRIILIIIAVLMITLVGCAAVTTDDTIISLNYSKGFKLTINQQNVDFTEYFLITKKDGTSIDVTQDMLDLTNINLRKEGYFTVTLTYNDKSCSALFSVIKAIDGSVDDKSNDNKPNDDKPVDDKPNDDKPSDVNQGDDKPNDDKPNDDKPSDDNPVDSTFATILAKYDDYAKWNFALSFTIEDASGIYWQCDYEFLQDDLKITYTDGGKSYTDYVFFDGDKVTYYADNGGGKHTRYTNENDVEELMSMIDYFDLTSLEPSAFTQSNGYYSAKNAESVGNSIFGDGSEDTWQSVKIYTDGSVLTKIVASTLYTMGEYVGDVDTFTTTFSRHGQIAFTKSDIDGSGNDSGDDIIPPTPTDTMPKQIYNAASHDDNRLQDVSMRDYEATGLPSIGSYNVLVIPVQFSDNSFDLDYKLKLEKAFNGTSADTGWESVKTYYQKSSFGKLNLTFDIMDAYTLSDSVSYYENYHFTTNITYDDGTSQEIEQDGANKILHEVLGALDASIDYSVYDTNNDGCLDAVYLIYSAPIVDDNDNSIYWAFTMTDTSDNKYDDKYAYYYLFAAYDFINEGNFDVDGNEIDGPTINAVTYIHETGHLFELDDYYDYDLESGCNLGLGGADIMDATVGDHNAYSKFMLGWIDPKAIVTSSQTVTLGKATENGDFAMVLLDYNGTNFCEYLLIDLYTNDGLNGEFAGEGGLLFDGAEYGVRIYHVSSSIDNPFGNYEYPSVTDYNNTNTDIALIRLVEADGETAFNGNDVTAKDDLWQTGDDFLTTFANYTRNDGKKINFNVTFVSVTKDSATITFTFED